MHTSYILTVFGLQLREITCYKINRKTAVTSEKASVKNAVKKCTQFLMHPHLFANLLSTPFTSKFAMPDLLSNMFDATCVNIHYWREINCGFT